MKQLTAIITGGKDQYGAWIEGLPIFGAGDTVEAVKKDIYDAIDLFVQFNTNIPEELQGEYEVNFTFDASGFIKYCRNFMDYPGMAKITGVGKKQLWDYANSDKKPRKEKASAIIEKLHTFGKELSKIEVKI